MQRMVIQPSSEAVATEIFVGEGILAELRGYCTGRVVIVADPILKGVAERLAGELGAGVLTVPRGKTQESAHLLMDELFKMGCGKETLLMALGGGATTDLVGYVASIYMRGVSLLLIPTTLLAMVDAAIGGKTAVDTPYGKNLIGTYYYPRAIFVDLDFLHTLPATERINGRAEILKMGLIQDASLWELAEKNGNDSELIPQAMQGKISVVEKDPRDRSLRHILNFGHTIGHALERMADYEMPHGQAVALGCLVEAHVSLQLGYLSQAVFERIQKGYRSFSLHLPTGYHRSALYQGMARDKKGQAGQIRMVLIDAIGHAIPFEGAYCRAVSETELAPSLDWMEGVYG